MRSSRESRQLIYSADFAMMKRLVGYLTENCFGNIRADCSSNCGPAPPAKGGKRAAKAAWSQPVSEPLMIRERPPRSTAVALLQAQGLPVSDQSGEHLEHFFLVGSDELLAGLVGLELYGTDTLLRSLVVAENIRGKGLGSTLTDHAEHYAASKAVRSIYQALRV